MRPPRSLHWGKRFSKPGTAPGTLTAPAERRVEQVTVTVMGYDRDHFQEHVVDRVEDSFAVREEMRGGGVAWIDVVGLHDVDLLRSVGERFDLHPLALEDVLNTGQRPKAEDYEDHHFVVMRLFHVLEASGGALDGEQIAIFLGDGFVLTFQEMPGDVFEPVRERIRQGKGRIRRMGADYLAYALLDSLVDHFFPVLEHLGERIEELEDEVMVEPGRDTVQRIHALKKELLVLRRAAWPQREVLATLERFESDRISRETRIFLRDCYDHAVQIMDMVETYRDLATSLLDIYLSSVSNRMNEVMKVLTVMASIFIPITFLAGVYGMNFDPDAGPWSMPELDWAWGYPAFWAVAVTTVAGLLWYFRRKDWI
jgi:magnesium transporter